MNSTKILFVSDTSGYGGLTKVVSNVAGQIKLEGCDVDLCFFYKANPELAKRLKDAQVIELNLTSERKKSKRYFKLFTEGLWKLYKLIRANKYEYVVSFAQTSLFLLVLLRFILRYKLVISERGDPNTNFGIFDKLRRYIFRFADKFVFQTPNARDCFPESIRRKSVVIPNPITIPPDGWDMANTKKAVVTFARFQISQKRHDILLEGFRLFHEKHPEYSLDLYGDGDDMDRVKSMVLEKDLSSSVFFRGRSTNVLHDLLSYRLFVITSDFEGMPNALMEAMAVGLPVISTDWRPGGVTSLIDDYVNGVIVPMQNPTALANAMEKVLSDEDKMVKMGRKARKSMERFDPKIIYKKWGEVFID